MTHQRTLIRRAIATAVGGVTTRVRPTQPGELPAIIVYALRETSELQTIRRALLRTASVQIELRLAETDALDDELDAACAGVEAAMAADPTFGRLALNSWLSATTIGLDRQGDRNQAVATLEYQVEYRTAG